MIAIDFQGGSHGNYLEFVCNKILGLTRGTPFNQYGASHSKQYKTVKVFSAYHYSFYSKNIEAKKIISIQISADDLLPLQQVSLLRAGDLQIDNDQLHLDTYNKFNNVHYRWILDQLARCFFHNQVKQSYDAVKDPSWPDINDKSDFERLPQWIQTECKEVHNLELLDLNESNPDCPRSILREFFMIGFLNPNEHGFIQQQKSMRYSADQDVYIFPYVSFYNLDAFLKEIDQVAQWAEISYNCQQDITDLHKEFLDRQPFKNSKAKCDSIVKEIQNNKFDSNKKLDLLEEAYINARLGLEYFR